MQKNELVKLALSIKRKKKVRDSAPVYELAKKLGLSDVDANHAIRYVGL